MKKLIVILLLGIIGIGCFFLFSGHKGFDITIKNQTNKKISGLYLTNKTSVIKIPSISSGEEYKFNVIPTGDFRKDSMDLHYKDRNGQLHIEYVLGYFEKDSYGDALITLKSVDENGKIQVEDTESTVTNR
ncbi:hypothetical protein [Bacillus sp. OAE603]|uniref:hypothetical protein n=1 Tax=Gottfriedia sp. OAE603 TaxID=2663872 RepID=UPI00178A6539